MKRRVGIISAVAGVAAAAAGGALIADRKVAAHRRSGTAALGDFEPARPTREGSVRTGDGIELHYVDDGPRDAKLAVVLVHGFCLSHEEFVFQQRALREHYGDRVRVIGYDHRSHGASQRSSAEHATIDQLGEDLHGILVELVPDAQVVLVGHSMGGMTIMALADRYPQLFVEGGKVAGVMLLSTSTGKLAEITLGLPAALARGNVVMPLLMRGMRRRAASGVLERGRAQAGDLLWVFIRRIAFGSAVDDGLAEFLARLIAATPVDVIADYYPTLMSHDKLAALGALRRTRVVVVVGEKDVLTPPAHAATIAGALPEAELVTVPGAGHQALMERPDVVNAALFDLVDAALAATPRRRRRRVVHG